MKVQDIFNDLITENHFKNVERSKLVSKYFKNEFNLSGGHSHLVPAVLNQQQVLKEDIALLDLCIRRADAQIIGASNVHLLLFEMGVWGSFGYINNKKEEEYRHLSLLLSFLDRCGIPITELYCTTCNGGQYLDKQILPDTDSEEILHSLGIRDERIFQTSGRRNFMLSRGIDRLAGYNIEFFVKRNRQFIEIASSNIYQYINKLTHLERTINSGIGCGVGIERIQFITEGYESVYDLEYFQDFKNDMQKILNITSESINIISDKIYRIAELSKTLIFLLNDEQGFDKSAQGKTMKTYLAKISSELDFLSIPYDKYILALQSNLEHLYNGLYPLCNDCYTMLFEEISNHS